MYETRLILEVLEKLKDAGCNEGYGILRKMAQDAISNNVDKTPSFDYSAFDHHLGLHLGIDGIVVRQALDNLSQIIKDKKNAMDLLKSWNSTSAERVRREISEIVAELE